MSNTTAAEHDILLDRDKIPIGFITAQITSLPIAIRVILTLLCIVIGVALCTVSPYAARWCTQWGIGSSELSHIEEADIPRKKFRLAGGVLGIFTGAIGASESHDIYTTSFQYEYLQTKNTDLLVIVLYAFYTG